MYELACNEFINEEDSQEHYVDEQGRLIAVPVTPPSFMVSTSSVTVKSDATGGMFPLMA